MKPKPNQTTVSSSHCVPTMPQPTVTLLGTLIVKVRDSRGELQQCRVFIDSGSESHFVSENCVARLGLKREKACVSLMGIGNQPAPSCKGKVDFSLISQTQNFVLPISAPSSRRSLDLILALSAKVHGLILKASTSVTSTLTSPVKLTFSSEPPNRLISCCHTKSKTPVTLKHLWPSIQSLGG